MRLFLVFLLILNVLYAAWNYFQPVQTVSDVRPLPTELRSLRLLSENISNDNDSPGESVSVENAKADVSIKIETEQSSTPVDLKKCFTLGPFKDESIMQQVKGALAENVDNLVVRKREESERHRYWVRIPSLGGRAQARLMSKALADKKIKDFYIVRSGSNKNSISLGHFREKKHADRRVKNLKKHDIDAEIEVIYRNYNLYWLDYSVEDQRPENDEFIQKFIIDGVARLNRDCK